jgi:hypothetical protein
MRIRWLPAYFTESIIMTQHTLEPGKHVIDAIVQIGHALRYAVRTEMPVERRHHPPAVDVAWFANDEHLYPLMIFEVESSATNAMAGNPAKVFGQSSEKFERPLFFFHLIVRSGSNTSRVDSLKGLFGSHNYRTYQLDRGMGTTLVKDILSQHRRIKNTVDIHSLLSVLMTSSELAADSEAILQHAATIGLRGAYLADTANLAGQHPEARALFLNHLRDRLVARKWSNIDTGYRSWLGHDWSRPIHLGLLSSTRPCDRAQILEQLRSWQEHSSFMPSAIGPHFGLSMDYDHFIFGAAAGLWALVASLMLEQPEALKYISEQLNALVRGLEHARPFVWPYSVTWGLHVTASTGNPVEFDAMRSFANERGGIPSRILYAPPAFLYIDDHSWHETVTQSPELVPRLNDFLSRRIEAVRHITRVDPVDLVLSVLGDEEGPDVDGAYLVKLLSRRDPARK